MDAAWWQAAVVPFALAIFQRLVLRRCAADRYRAGRKIVDGSDGNVKRTVGRIILAFDQVAPDKTAFAGIGECDAVVNRRQLIDFSASCALTSRFGFGALMLLGEDDVRFQIGQVSESGPIKDVEEEWIAFDRDITKRQPVLCGNPCSQGKASAPKTTFA